MVVDRFEYFCRLWFLKSSLHQNRWFEIRWTEGEKYLVLFHRAAIIRSQVFIGPKVKWPLKLRCVLTRLTGLFFCLYLKLSNINITLLVTAKRYHHQQPGTSTVVYLNSQSSLSCLLVLYVRADPVNVFFVFLWRRKQVPRNVQSVFCF